MRVISEDRRTDIPYERSIIYYHGGFKQIIADCLSANEYVLKSEVKSDEAEQIILDIRMAYSMGRKIYEIPEKG